MIDTQSSSLQLEPSVIRVESAKGIGRDVFGTAFLIHRTRELTYWLTCAHVINDIGGIQNVRVKDGNRYKPVELAGLDSESLKNLRDNYDLAVFKVKGLFDKDTLELAKTSYRESDFISLGNFIGPNSLIGMRPVSGSLYADFIVSNEHPAWMYKLEMDTRSPLERGYSGSPIYVPELKQVVGVINQRHRNENTQGYGISVEAATSIFQKVPDLNMLCDQILTSGVRATSWVMKVLDKPLRLALSKQTRLALDWFSQERIVNLSKKACDYAVEHSEDLKSELEHIPDPQDRLELIGDFQWEFEKYLERIYGSLLTDSKDLLINNRIKPSLSAEAYESAFDYIKSELPESLESKVISKISGYMECLIENLYSD